MNPTFDFSEVITKLVSQWESCLFLLKNLHEQQLPYLDFEIKV